MSSLRFMLKACGLLLAAALLPGTVRAAETINQNQMVVLELKVTATAVSLIHSTVVSGTVKPQPEPEAGIEFQLRSADNVVLRRGMTASPLLRRVCVETSPGSGEMKTQFIEESEGYLVLRIPADKAAASISFYDRPVPAGRAVQSATQKLLGTISFAQP